MEWRDVNLRFCLKDGDICCVKVDKQYSHAGYKLGVYKGGNFWDAIVLDDRDLWIEEWTVMDDVAEEFLFTGVNVFEEKKNIN